MFNNIYKDKKILITGHTGFKGTWLTIWLLRLGATIVGISKDVPTNPSMFKELELELKIKSLQEDIRDLPKMIEIISDEKPDFLFHLAAQPVVSKSYSDPIETLSSNVMGVANILESLKKSNHKCVAIIITSDKAYENVEQVWGYKENDKMGGKDVYSGSKGAAELVIKSYFHSFFKNKESNVRIAIGRAGNVIGGGDWARDRIVVDCMIAWNKGESVEIRSPNATRPWQHVLEPLSGYLNLGQILSTTEKLNGEGFNFGPRADQNHTVQKLLVDLSDFWNFDSIDRAFTVVDDMPFHEAELLKLNCDKSLFYLRWQASMNYKDTIKFTSEWYYTFYHNKNTENIMNKTLAQIEKYEFIAKDKALPWTE